MASRYPSEWKEEVRQRADIVTIVSEYVPLKQRGHDYWACCPLHGEKTPSFKVSPERGTYYCFGCKANGDVFSFIQAMERMEFPEAARYLAEKVNVPVPEMTHVDEKAAAERRSLKERIVALNRDAARFYHEQLYTGAGEEVLTYLHGRGLDDPAIRLFGIGAAPVGWDILTKHLLSQGATVEELVSAGLTVQKDDKCFDMFRNRAIFPIINAHGTVLGFGGRAMGDVQPKYLNTADTPAFNKRENVYAANMLRKTRGLDRVLLVEGYMDVASLVRHGVTGVAATLGTALTPQQAKLMKRYAPEIWITYDGDSAGQNATLRALDVLEAEEIPAKVLIIPDGKDPDDFIRQEGREAFEALKPLTAPLYRMQRAQEGLDLSTEEGRTQYAIACAAIIRKVKHPVEVENLLKRLMIATGYSREVLIQQIGITVPEKTTYSVPAAQRKRVSSSAQSFLPEHIKSERMLLALLAHGRVEAGVVSSDEFTDAGHRAIAVEILLGKTEAAMLDACEDETIRAVIGEIFADAPKVEPGLEMKVITQCKESIRRVWIQERITALQDKLPTCEPEEKIDLLQEFMKLQTELGTLRPGRKE